MSQQVGGWEVHFVAFDDGTVVALYCHKCGQALDSQPATRREWVLTPSKLRSMVEAHIKKSHAHEGPPST